MNDHPAVEPDIADGSLPLLQQRLRRIEFVLTGNSDLDGLPQGASKTERSDETIIAKLHALQSNLDRLRRQDGVAGTLIREVESLSMHLRGYHPEDY